MQAPKLPKVQGLALFFKAKPTGGGTRGSATKEIPLTLSNQGDSTSFQEFSTP